VASKSPQSHAKRARELAVREKRELKAAKKAERAAAREAEAAEPPVEIEETDDVAD
jgi:hypothetical protein